MVEEKETVMKTVVTSGKVLKIICALEWPIFVHKKFASQFYVTHSPIEL